MGIFEDKQKLPGKGYSGKKCDNCKTKTDATKASKGPHIGSSMLMKRNRYFCSTSCMADWKATYM